MTPRENMKVITWLSIEYSYHSAAQLPVDLSPFLSYLDEIDREVPGRFFEGMGQQLRRSASSKENQAPR